jgi:hypothetical protein
MLKCVTGNGKIDRSERAIGAATELDLDGAFLATITLGAGPSLVIEGVRRPGASSTSSPSAPIERKNRSE